jgi:hypothetical protein
MGKQAGETVGIKSSVICVNGSRSHMVWHKLFSYRLCPRALELSVSITQRWGRIGHLQPHLHLEANTSF